MNTLIRRLPARGADSSDRGGELIIEHLMMSPYSVFFNDTFLKQKHFFSSASRDHGFNDSATNSTILLTSTPKS